MPIEKICNPELCTACFACMSVCPKDAISSAENGLGEEVPVINPEKCVSCGRCISVCPSNKKMDLRRADYCYAAWSKSAEDLIKSSSGGIAAVLSRCVIRDGGVVYGSTSRDSKVFHERIDSIESIDSLRGSKYVKSDSKSCFKDVLEDLNSGRNVLFTGTPCQVAGLKSFLGKEYQSLFTVDLVCHGTPPFTYLKEYLESKCNRGLHKKDWDEVSFRMVNSFEMRVFSKGSTIYQKQAGNDLYYSAFLQGLIFRSNCYQCPYAKSERVGDLTIGDFWGIDRNKLGIEYDGKVSLILPNTQKGLVLLQLCEKDMKLTQLPLEDALNPQQGNLLHPSIPHEERKNFENLYIKHGFVEALKKTNHGKRILREERARNIRGSIPFRILRRIYHIFT